MCVHIKTPFLPQALPHSIAAIRNLLEIATFRWPETPVSKTGMGYQSIGGSNPPLSAHPLARLHARFAGRTGRVSVPGSAVLPLDLLRSQHR